MGTEPEPTPPLPAATVILLNDGAEGLETLLLRRDARGAFGGMWVFPGGRVDPGDADDDQPDDELVTARRAAAREANEEAGLDLEAAFLVPFSHWTPPAIAPRRFATWFFVAPTPDGDVVVDGTEVHDHTWIAPAAALRRHAGGDLQLAPPTWVTLSQLQAFERTSEVLAAAAARSPEHFVTRPLEVDGVAVLTWHGDAAYEGGDSDAPGPRHRLWMAEAGWRYERTR